MIYGLGQQQSAFDERSLLSQRQRELERVRQETQEAEQEFQALKAGKEYRKGLKEAHRAQLATDVAAKYAPPPPPPPPPPSPWARVPLFVWVAGGVVAVIAIRRIFFK